MSREDAEKLLGGYATGTLTAQEQRALFEAALEDQHLFDALARELALRDLLSDPAARAQLLRAVDEAPAPRYRRWWRLAPVAAMAAALAVVAVVELSRNQHTPHPLPLAKLQGPASASQPAPILPPPPEIALATPPLIAPFSLPAVAPAAPPSPPPPPAVRATLGTGALDDRAAAIAPLPGRPSPSALTGSLNGFVATGSGSAGLATALLQLHGTVTDTTGAAVPSADVEVRSAATGEVFRTSTNERGEFGTPFPLGGAYQVSASAPGFKTATLSGAAPIFGVPGPVNVRLEVGASTESVTVSAESGPLKTEAAAPPAAGMAGVGGGGRGGALARLQALGGFGGPGAESAAHSGLRYRVLRQMKGGDRVEVAAERNVAAGATVILQVTADADGYLRITQANGRVIVSRAVRRMQPLEAQLPKFRKPQRVEFQVDFSRQPFEPKKRGLADGESVTVTLNFE